MFQKNKPKNTSLIPAPRKDGSPSVVSKDMHILGNIVGDGVIDFNGSLDGNIRCDTLTIRADASVKGEIVANYVSVYGKVNGLIRARTVVLHTGCHVEGIIMHEALTIEDGAFVDGKFKRTDRTHSESEPDAGFDEELPASGTKILENIRLIR